MIKHAILFLLSVGCIQARAQQAVSTGKVGPAAMPDQVEAWQTPFGGPAPVAPQFASNRVELQAPGSNATVAQVTEHLQATIDKVSDLGGGTVMLASGIWPTGRIELKSGVNLQLAAGAELHFSGEIKHYLPAVFTRYEGIELMSLGGLVYAQGQANIAITGAGKLVGPPSGPVREACPGLSDQVVDFNAPVATRVMDGQQGRHYFRPYFICPVDCQHVLIEGVTLENGPMWNIVPIYCRDVLIRGVTIDSQHVVNGDGVDVESSQNVLVEYCQVNTGDDCFALKAGRNADGLRTARPVENVVIRHCRAVGGIGGLTCGSETAGTVRNVYVHDCEFENVRHAAYMKTRRPRGGGVKNVLLERIRFRTYNHAVMFDMIGSPLYVGELGKRLPKRELTAATPYYRNITMRHLQGESPKGAAIKIKGIPESPARDLRFEDCLIASQQLLDFTDAKDVTVAGCSFTAEENSIQLLDCVDVAFQRNRFDVSQGALRLSVAGPESRDISWENCSPDLGPDSVQYSDGATAGAVELAK